MKISILTLFPEMFQGPFDHSIVQKAVQKKIIELEYVNIRNFGIGKHHTVDDKPYGGGVGMVMRVDVVDSAIQFSKCDKKKNCKERIIALDASGKSYKQETASWLSKFDHLILICGHYEGIDARVDELIDEKISIGDYVLTGGEIPAMVIADSVVRLIPGVLGKDESSTSESFQTVSYKKKSTQLLEYPHYTRPNSYKGLAVPSVLLSGNHNEIEKFRMQKALEKTKKNRSDLLTTVLPGRKHV